MSPKRSLQNKGMALIGMRGSGKTCVGSALAALLQFDHLDTDDLVQQRAGTSIVQLFRLEGEVAFRRREHEVIQHVVRKAPAVISVGGGAILDERNVRLLKQVATLVWLTAPAEVLWERMASDPATTVSRPSLTPLPGVEEVRRLLVDRSPFYQAAADLVVDTQRRTPQDVAQVILAELRSPTDAQST